MINTQKKYYLIYKRIIDIVLSFCMILLLFLPVAAISLALTIYFKGNPFYIAERCGIQGKIIHVYKLRTMSNKTDSAGNLLPDAERITKVGLFLRQFSVDELPQFLNVLIGTMSLVGPRPLDSYFLNLYTSEQKKRLDVKPGITGLAQVKGRNTISWEEKFSYDLQYIKSASLKLDFIIILKTIKLVINREGVNQDGYINAERFTGKS
jgi:lipopolysaccharide/colanic/teichoic acid biosynthesis glycosyltransferase